MGHLQVVEGEENTWAGMFLLGTSETMGHSGWGDLAHQPGVFPTDTGVKMLKEIKPRPPSQSRFLSESLGRERGGEDQIFFLTLLFFNKQF